MMQEELEGIDHTRRCLFPVDDETFDSELGCNAMVRMVEDENLNDHKYQYERSSPTGVLEYPSMFLSKRDPLHSIVEMGDDGAEVTLTMPHQTFETPGKADWRNSPATSPRKSMLGQVRNNSLLDVDCTPTPPPTKKPHKKQKSSLVDVWCSNASSQYVEDDEYQMKLEVEQSSPNPTGQPSPSRAAFGSCSNWQLCLFTPPRTPTTETEDEVMERFRLNLRKRALDLRARRTRVHQLRRDLSPFGKSPNRRSPQLFRSRSFSVADHASAIVRQSKERRSIGFSNVLQLCTPPENVTAESPTFVRRGKHNHDEGVCYDSDPEDFARRRSPRRPFHHNNNCVQYNYPSTIKTEDALDEFAYKGVVQEFLNTTSTLVYHPIATGASGVLDPVSQVAVDAWLERGQLLHEIIQPKWMWRLKPRYKESGARVQMMEVRSIELLEITRILKVARVDRVLYPFAKTGHCFVIRNIEGTDYCFEAISVEERDRIVYSLKLVIARFGAMVLAADENVYDEFFVTDSPAEGPGMLDVQESTQDERYRSFEV